MMRSAVVGEGSYREEGRDDDETTRRAEETAAGASRVAAHVGLADDAAVRGEVWREGQRASSRRRLAVGGAVVEAVPQWQDCGVCRGYDGPDLISCLPDKLLHHILSFVTTPEVKHTLQLLLLKEEVSNAEHILDHYDNVLHCYAANGI
uniref:F-box domain-containing protein n=1 Tax=Oryza punctata TaxID=4537 RepID=A0A0E0JIK3_ORYPU